MTQKEWIISLDDDLKDYEELFVGNVRDGDRLIRCKDCKHWQKSSINYNEYVCYWGGYVKHEDDFCSWAKRAKE